MKRIVFIGAAGCGKSSLAAAVFAALKQTGALVEHAHEFIRNDIQAHGPMTSIWEQYRTRQLQKELEDAVPACSEYMICDSGTLLPYFYAVLYADRHDPRQRLVLQDMYKYLLDDLYLCRYDMIFYLPMLHGGRLNDGTRYQSSEEIALLDEHMRLFFTKLHRLNVCAVESAFDQRLAEVMDKILGTEYLTMAPNTAIVNSSVIGDVVQNY